MPVQGNAIDVHYKTGIHLFDEKNYQAAISELQKYLEQEPHPEINAYLYLGKALFLTSQFLSSIDQLTVYIKKTESANLPFAHDLLAQCYAALNEKNTAFLHYQKATELDPSCASAWHNWGLLHMTIAEQSLDVDLSTCIDALNLAKKCFVQSLVLMDTNPIFFNSLAGWHSKFVEVLQHLVNQHEEICKHYDLAIQHYQKSLTHSDKSDTIFKNIVYGNMIECLAQFGHHHYKLGNYDEALTKYSAVLEYDGTHVASLNQSGMCFFRKADYQKAREYFFLIIERIQDPQEQADAWLNIACCYRHESNPEKAKEAIIKAKTLSPTDSYILEEEDKILSAFSIPPALNNS